MDNKQNFKIALTYDDNTEEKIGREYVRVRR